jgi:putative ABC transport system permease protein
MSAMRPLLRSIRRSPSFLAGAVSVLALGFTAAILVFAIAHALFLAPVDYRDPASLVQLRSRDPQGNLLPLTPAEFRAAQARHDWTATPAAVDLGMFLLTGVPEPEEFAGAAITVNTLATLGVQPTLGHDLTAAQPDEVLLSHRAWTRRFGADPAIVGKVVDLDWQRTPTHERYRVAGVLPPRFWLFYRGLEVFVPLTDTMIDKAPRRRYYAIARGSAREIPGGPPGHTLTASPLLRDLTGDSRPAVLLLSAAAALLVLLACANVSSLFLARGLRRRPEFAIRLAIGASRWDLARLVLSESLTVSIAAALIAAPLATAGLKLLTRYLPADAGFAQFTPGIDRLSIDAWALGFAALAAFLCSIVAAALPMRASSTVSANLRPARQPYRHILIGAEVALATVLLCGAALLLKSVVHLDRADLGFLRDRILVVRAPRISGRPDPAYYDELRRRVESIPGVEAVTFASFQPLTNTRAGRSVSVPAGSERTASYSVVAHDFFAVYGNRLLAGRAFSETDTAGAPPVVIVNRALAQTLFPGRSPIGLHLQLDGDRAPSEIVGIVSDIRQSLRDPAPPTVYRAAAQDPGANLQMGVRTYLRPLAVAAAVRREIGLAGGAAAELSTLDEFVFGQSWNTQLTGAIVVVFSTVALAIAAFGIFSVVSYVTSQRTREIGIRMALGARSSDIGAMLLGNGLRPIAAGLIAGLAAAFALSRLLRGLLYDVQPNDPAAFTTAAIVLLVAALCALAVPARRAIRTNPADCLRQL